MNSQPIPSVSVGVFRAARGKLPPVKQLLDFFGFQEDP